MAVILRPGKTPGGAEVALVLRHLVGAIRKHWPRIEILIRGDSHYSRPEALGWLERHRVGYIFGLAGNQALLREVAPLADANAMARLAGATAKARRYAEFRYAAKTWQVARQVIARVEASAQGTDSRFIVTNLKGAPRWLYEAVYCARGHRLQPIPRDVGRADRAENLIKAHKLHLASDRTSCSKATANEFRLLVHRQQRCRSGPAGNGTAVPAIGAAYWLLHTLRGLAPKASFWRDAQFDTIRLALIKVAARVTELATRIKRALPSCCPHQDSLIRLAARAAKLPP